MVHVALDPGKQFTFSTSLIIAHLTAFGIYYFQTDSRRELSWQLVVTLGSTLKLYAYVFQILFCTGR